jgi:hypothetical protein
MRKLQAPRVKVVSSLSRQRRPWLATGDVERVAHEGMAMGGHVNADLVRASSGDLDLDESPLRTLTEDPDMGKRRTAARSGGEDLTEPWVGHGADGRVDGEGRPLWSTRYESEIRLADALLLPLPHHRAPCVRVTSEEHDARRAPPQSMSRSGIGEALIHEPKQRVLQKATVWYRRKSGRLGDRQKAAVLVEDGESQRDGRLFPRRSTPNEKLARFEEIGCCCVLPVDRDLAAGDARKPHVLCGVGVSRREVNEHVPTRIGRPYPLGVLVSGVHGGGRSIRPGGRDSMLTGDIGNQIDRIWDAFEPSDLSNPPSGAASFPKARTLPSTHPCSSDHENSECRSDFSW